MGQSAPDTLQLHNWLRRMRGGDAEATDELLRHLSARLQHLARQMLRGHPAVKRWVETDDVFQGAVVRLLRAVQTVSPDSMRAFFALATQQIRWELIDLARHYCGPAGPARHQVSGAAGDAQQTVAVDRPDSTFDPSDLAEWREFHETIDRLPEDEREVVGLLFYQGLSQADAASLLGVTVRTVQRRWHAALLQLHDVLRGQWPGT